MPVRWLKTRRKINKKGKSGASNENGVNKDETEECEVQGDTAVQV